MAYQFDGVDDNITATVSGWADGDWTIGGWFFPETTGEGGEARIINPTSTICALNATNTLRGLQVYSGTDAETIANNSTIALNAWNLAFWEHIASTNTIKIYVGDLDTTVAEVTYASQVTGTSTFTTSTSIFIGNNSVGTRTFDGAIERVFITERTLTSGEREEIRTGDFSSLLDASLVAYWPLVENALDFSGNDFDGTVNGATLTSGPVFGATATPSAIALPITLPASTESGTANITPSPVTVAISIPATTESGTGTTTPGAIAVPITIPQVIAQSEGGGLAQPGAIAVPITLPSATLAATSTTSPNPIEVSAALPTPSFVADSNVSPVPISVPIEIPTPTIEGNIGGVATPDPIEVSVSVPALTADEIPTFTAPATDTYKPYNSETRGPTRRMARHRRPGVRGKNVYFIDGVVTEVDPVTTYDAQGVVIAVSWDRVDKVWWGGHEAEQVTTEQATALTAAGYTLGQDVLVGV